MLAVFEHSCCYCGAKEKLCLDHLTALAAGGRTMVGNVAPACRTCNLKKGRLSAEDFKPGKALEIRRRAWLGRAPGPPGAPIRPMPKRVVVRGRYVYARLGLLRSWYPGLVVSNETDIMLLLTLNVPVDVLA